VSFTRRKLSSRDSVECGRLWPTRRDIFPISTHVFPLHLEMVSTFPAIDPGLQPSCFSPRLPALGCGPCPPLFFPRPLSPWR
jgi:hypothetical protein